MTLKKYIMILLLGVFPSWAFAGTLECKHTTQPSCGYFTETSFTLDTESLEFVYTLNYLIQRTPCGWPPAGFNYKGIAHKVESKFYIPVTKYTRDFHTPYTAYEELRITHEGQFVKVGDGESLSCN